MVESHRSLAHRIAADLLEIGAVILSPEKPFTWASGLKSPIYCDNRLTMSYPRVRRSISEGFETLLQELDLHPETVVGTATAGIPHACWLADRLNLPMAYVRSKPKAHGRGNQIEGRLPAGQRVVVVEDLVSTGMSSVAVVKAVQEAEVTVLATLAIFSYGLPGAAASFEAVQVPLYTLTHFEALIEVARSQNRLSSEAVASLQAWHQNPQAWSSERAG